MNLDDRNKDENEPQASPKLLAALKQLPRERVFVPPAIDRAVLDAARRQLTRPARERHFFRPWLIWPAFAAACALLAATAYVLGPWVHSSKATFAREDLNRDGQVDILDAFALARQVRDGDTAPNNLDFNRDGVIDRRDAEVIAVQVVKLEKGGRS